MYHHIITSYRISNQVIWPHELFYWAKCQLRIKVLWAANVLWLWNAMQMKQITSPEGNIIRPSAAQRLPCDLTLPMTNDSSNNYHCKAPWSKSGKFNLDRFKGKNSSMQCWEYHLLTLSQTHHIGLYEMKLQKLNIEPYIIHRKNNESSTNIKQIKNKQTQCTMNRIAESLTWTNQFWFLMNQWWADQSKSEPSSISNSSPSQWKRDNTSNLHSNCSNLCY